MRLIERSLFGSRKGEEPLRFGENRCNEVVRNTVIADIEKTFVEASFVQPCADCLAVGQLVAEQTSDINYGERRG